MNVREKLERLAQQPWLIALGVVLLLGIWMASGAGRNPEQDSERATSAASDPGAVPKVRTMSVTAEPVARTLNVSGRTAPARTVELKAETNGRIVAVPVRRGSRVRAGEVLIRLDAGEREARLDEARARVRQRELEYEGTVKLKPEGYVSDTLLAQSAAELESARAALRTAQLDLERMEIRAPFDGALQERQVEIGDYVSPGNAVATFVDDRTLVVVGSIAEQHALAVKKGSKGTARLATGQVAQGTVRYIAPVADPATRTFAVELEFANRDAKLPAGVTAEIDLPVGTVMAHRISPALLTLDDGGGLGVKIVDDNGQVLFIAAQIVRSSADGVWVTGLPDPARIITVGQGFVKPEQVVQIVDAHPAETAVAAEKTRGSNR